MFEISKERIGINSIKGPILIIEGVKGVGYDEVVEIKLEDGSERRGKVLETSDDFVVLQLFEGTSGINPKTSRVRFTGKPLEIGLSEKMLGRVFNGAGKPIDNLFDIIPETYRNVNGESLNPVVREYPREYIETGITAIDLMNTLVRGQKLPIFSAAGLPHNELAAQIAAQAKLPGEEAGNFAVVFAAMGIKNDDAFFFINNFEERGALKNVVMFLNLANDPPIERIVTPRVALTVAEYLAYDKGKHVLVILTDMTSYCEALREIANARGEVPARKGFPGYMYSDLATIYERAGRVKGREGSITQVPILTMPNDDITHPVPDLTGYITEGQIVLSRDLYGKGIYPPIDVLPSLSRLMKDSIGKGYTRDDHPHLFMQLYASYARVKEVRSIASIVGEEELTPVDKAYLRFGNEFERNFIGQGFTEDRSIEYSLGLGWKMLSILPKTELSGLKEEEIEKYYIEIKEEV
ncbi:MAG: V-type ATP synthase subunit B [Brevinematales bacterium]|nr:V-type ATP synthase subunit B [Brevinematales bacterium]